MEGLHGLRTARFQRGGLLDAVVCLVGGLVVDQRLANGRVSHMRAFGGMVRVDGGFCFDMVMGFLGLLLAV